MISAIISELARRSADAAFASVYTGQEESMIPVGSSDSSDPREQLAQLFRDTLRRQQAKFAGRVHDETDERSVRLGALIVTTFELNKAVVPALDVALQDPTNRRNATQNLSAEYMPLLMLDPVELPRVFAEYMLWHSGDEQGAATVDVDYLRRMFREGVSRLPEAMREMAIERKHAFAWGRLI